jgi:hypothetical protein
MSYVATMVSLTPREITFYVLDELVGITTETFYPALYMPIAPGETIWPPKPYARLIEAMEHVSGDTVVRMVSYPGTCLTLTHVPIIFRIRMNNKNVAVYIPDYESHISFGKRAEEAIAFVNAVRTYLEDTDRTGHA